MDWLNRAGYSGGQVLTTEMTIFNHIVPNVRLHLPMRILALMLHRSYHYMQPGLSTHSHYTGYLRCYDALLEHGWRLCAELHHHPLLHRR